METYSAQTSVKPSATLMAALVLMSIALSQSFSLVYQKQRQWDLALGGFVEIDDQLSLKIPSDWEQLAARDVALWTGQPTWSAHTMRFVVERPSDIPIRSLDEACKYVVAQLMPEAMLVTIHAETRPVNCLLGSEPAQMTVIQPEGGRFVAVVLASLSESRNPVILAMWPIQGAQAEAKCLMQRIAQTAEFTIY